MPKVLLCDNKVRFHIDADKKKFYSDTATSIERLSNIVFYQLTFRSINDNSLVSKNSAISYLLLSLGLSAHSHSTVDSEGISRGKSHSRCGEKKGGDSELHFRLLVQKNYVHVMRIDDAFSALVAW